MEGKGGKKRAVLVGTNTNKTQNKNTKHHPKNKIKNKRKPQKKKSPSTTKKKTHNQTKKRGIKVVFIHGLLRDQKAAFSENFYWRRESGGIFSSTPLQEKTGGRSSTVTRKIQLFPSSKRRDGLGCFGILRERRGI